MNRKVISEQLAKASELVMNADGSALYTSVLDVCGELVNMVATGLSGQELDIESVKDMTSCITYAGKGLDSLSNSLCDAECVKVSTQSIHKLSQAVSERELLLAREQSAWSQLADVEKTIETLKPEVAALEEKYSFQQNFKASLEKSLEEYSQEKLSELARKNDELVQLLVMKKTELEDLQTKKQESDKQIADVNKLIAQMPTEQQLVDEYDAVQSEYNRLLTAKTECSQKKQLEIKEQIDKVEKEVSELEGAMNILKARKQEIDTARTNIDTAKGTFETDFVEKLESAMDELKTCMLPHRQTLNKLKDDAEELKKHIDECDSIYKNYSFMFDVCKKPLEAVANASKMEYKELAKVYDINKSKYVEELKVEIGKKLEELGKVIDECRRATTVDQNTLHAKAFGKGKK